MRIAYRYFRESARKTQGFSREESAAFVGIEFTASRNSQLNQRRRQRSDNHHDQEFKTASPLVAISPVHAAEHGAPPRHLAEHHDGAGEGRRDRGDENVAMQDVR